MMKYFGEERAPSVHYIAEADSHGIFEVRFHSLGHPDGSLETAELEGRLRRTTLEDSARRNKPAAMSQAAREAALLFQKFASLSTYYNEVNKVCYNVCPAFYKFKIQPFQSLFDKGECMSQDPKVDNASGASDAGVEADDSQRLRHDRSGRAESHVERDLSSAQGDSARSTQGAQRREARINRVYEVEEHMGGDFIEELAKMHYDHVKLQEHSLTARLGSALAMKAGLAVPEEEQKSLPAYVYGLKIAQMCKRLEQVTCYGRGQLRGGGRIIYDPELKCLRGDLPRVTQSSYYEYDRKRYRTCLENFKGGWSHYLSVLETEIIESKLLLILDSLTFKYSRQPQFLVITPDRVAPMNLRISEKIKVLNKDAAGDNDTKFFKPLSEDLIDPNREIDVANHVDSVLQTLTHAMLKKDLD